MGETYKDKNITDIKKDVKNEFKRIDRFMIRDDQEIYTSGLNIIKKYRDDVLKSDRLIKKEKYIVGKDGKPILLKTGNEYRNAAKRYFTEAYNEIVNLHNNVKGRIKLTSNATDEKIIGDVAQKIDKAENDALSKIEEYCNPMQEGSNESYHSSVVKDEQGKVKVTNGEIVKQKPLYTQSKDGTLILTDRTNPIKINEALGGLFKNKDRIYKIDYSKCTNEKIKQKMQSLIGGLSCRIKYDTESQTYVLTDQSWNMLSDRALVWEGVTLKQDTIIKSQSQDNKKQGMTSQEQSSLEALRSSSKPFEFNPNNYKYYVQYHIINDKDVCAAYAYGVVSDILAKQGCCFTATDVSTWQIAGSSYIKPNFSIDTIDSDNPQQQIVNAPAGTFLTVKFNRTEHKEYTVSHTMVSLGNGVYTDLFGSHIRLIDFKSQVSFSGNTFTYGGGSYTLTEGSRLITPKMGTFMDGSEQTITGENITPEAFTQQIYESTGANKNYIRSLIVSQNNISLDQFYTKCSNLSVKIIKKEITDLNLENNEGSSDVANHFLNSLKEHKTEIMNHYPKLSNHEYDEIAKRAMGILYQESNAGDSTKYKLKEGIFHNNNIRAGIHDIPIIGSKVSDKIEDYGNKKGGRSRGYTQIKFDQIFNDMYNKDGKDFLKEFGITGESDLTDAKKCGIATIVGLITNYNNTIIPMKSDPFRRNNAEIIHIQFNDDTSEDIARGKALYIDGVRRPRTEDEIQATIDGWASKHGGIKEQKVNTRYGINNDDAFFDFLYYTWNKPSEIYYGTATIDENNYRRQANSFVKDHTNTDTYMA